jgi:hypothetical protein
LLLSIAIIVPRIFVYIVIFDQIGFIFCQIWTIVIDQIGVRPNLCEKGRNQIGRPVDQIGVRPNWSERGCDQIGWPDWSKKAFTKLCDQIGVKRDVTGLGDQIGA